MKFSPKYLGPSNILNPVINKAKNTIEVNLAGYSMKGLTLTSPTVIAKVDKITNIKFDKENTFITVAGVDSPLQVSFID